MAATVKLAPLRSQLAAVRRRRWLARAVCGAMLFGLLLLGVLVADFLVDWLFQLSRTQRLFLTAACAGVGLWGLVRLVWPVLAARESEMDLALLVERQQGIDSDLVAALQFEAGTGWGSTQLEQAVVDYVADFGSSLKIPRAAEPRFRRVALAFSASALLCTALVLRYPGYAAALLDRFLLGTAHYPTRTHITRIAVNGLDVFPRTKSSPVPRIPYGHAARFEISATGERPESGEIRIAARQGSDAAQLELQPRDRASGRDSQSDGGTNPAAAEATSYAAELSRCVESLSYQVYLGDAWTEPAPIEVLPLPLVTLTLDHTPPAYAAARERRAGASSSRQISVIEGSQVELFVNSNKPLARAELVIGTSRHSLQSQDDSRQFWKLTGPESPLAHIAESIVFEVAAVDDDGLSPEQPLRGHIRIETDRPPRVAAAVVTDKVLPAAQPTISWGAADDFGIAEVRLHRQITRASGEVQQGVDSIQTVPQSEQPRPNLRGRFPFDLGPLALAKGDEVRVTIEAVDFRGPHPGSSVQSEPIAFHVTDESGILAALVEADEKSAKQLDQIIQRQLGVSEGR